MKKKIYFLFVAFLLSYGFIFAQDGGVLVEIRPLNPPNQPPYDGVVTLPDTSININPYSVREEVFFDCYQSSGHLSISCNGDESVTVVVYEMISGVKYTSTLNMVAGEVYTINTPWGAGLYTIRLILTDGTILEGDFQIK